MTTLWMIVGCGVLAILYGIWATRSVLAADAGTAKMQEISAAVREGAQAYLKRQYTTIAMRRRGDLPDPRASRSAGWSPPALRSARSSRAPPASSA